MNAKKFNLFIDFIDIDEALNLFESENSFGFDIETYGYDGIKDALNPDSGGIRLMQFYFPQSSKSFILDLGKDPERSPQKELSIILRYLRNPKKLKYIHNAAFESLWIAKKFRYPILNIMDSMILSQIYFAGLYEYFNKFSINIHSLQGLCKYLFNIDLDKSFQSYDYRLDLSIEHLKYAALDAKAAYFCGEFLYQKALEKDLDRLIKIEMEAIPAFSMLNAIGIPFNLEKASKYLNKINDHLDILLKDLNQNYPDLNPNSPKQVLRLLHSLGYSFKKSSYDNLFYSMNDPKSSSDLKSFISKLLKWRKIKKQAEYLSQYIEKASFNKYLNSYVVRSTYIQNAFQATGRSCSSNPNLQNIPSEYIKELDFSLRDFFEAPPGFKFIIIDLAACHAQIARYLSHDKSLLDALKKKIKIHFYTISGILKLSNIHLSPEEIIKIKSDDTHPLYEKINLLYAPAKMAFYAFLNLSGPYYFAIKLFA